MTESPATTPSLESPKPRWRPLSAIDRRVLGVLAEKAKTTPDAYPLSLNAVCTGCNQRNNRAPLMQLTTDDVEPSLDRLREMGAVGIVQGYGRVSKYRHYLYEWLGVDKVEMAVMTELLLRGAQTEGELRGRASRMEPIPGLAELRPVLESLKKKNLLVALTPEGRGHVVAHNLYPPAELQRLRAEFAQGLSSAAVAASAASLGTMAVGTPCSPPASSDALPTDLGQLRAELAQLRKDVDELTEQLRLAIDELDRLRG